MASDSGFEFEILTTHLLNINVPIIQSENQATAEIYREAILCSLWGLHNIIFKCGLICHPNSLILVYPQRTCYIL